MVDRVSLSGLRYTLLACFVISDVTMAVTSSSLWNSVGQKTVTSSVATSTASRVATRCVMECHQMESCVSVAFDPESDICYLQPTCRPARQGDDGPLDVYTREKVSECKPSEAPTVVNAYVTQWRMTSSSLDGNVSCDEDYMLSKDVTPYVRCQLDNGVWTTLMMSATCVQFAWRNYTVKLNPVKYPLPVPARVGLTVRVRGTPTHNTRFYINLGSRVGDNVFHIDLRLNVGDNVKVTEVNHKQGGRWGKGVRLQDPIPPFPFAEGVPFEMVITAVSLYTFRVEVNSVRYADYTGVLPVTDVTNVYAYYDVSIESLVIKY